MHRPVLQERAPTPAVIERIDADTFWEMQFLPEYRDKEYELINGEMIRMAAPGGVHGWLGGLIATYLNLFLFEHDLGRATIENAFASEYDSLLLLRPDVAFISHGRSPVPFPVGKIPVMPDLAVEIRSPTDTLLAMRDKADIYLDNGTQLVWLVIPNERRVEIHAADESITILGIEDTITGGDVLPGFALPLRRLFDL